MPYQKKDAPKQQRPPKPKSQSVRREIDIKEQVKTILKDMIKNGELQVGLEWESMWGEIYVKVSMDGEELAKESVYLQDVKIKSYY